MSLSIDQNPRSIEPPTRYDLTKDIFNKAVVSCIICYPSRIISHQAALAYGGLAGLIQLLFSSIHNKIDEKTTSDQAKKLNYLFSAYLPWVLSGLAVHQIYKKTGRTCTRLSFEMGLTIALIQQVVGRTNMHLLPKD